MGKLRLSRNDYKNVDEAIETYLNCKTPCYFGDIKHHLEKIGLDYKNSDKYRTGIAHALKRMQEKGKIRKMPKDHEHPYPWYVSLQQSTFDVALDGHLLRSEIGEKLQHILDNQDFVSDISKIDMKKLNNDELFILKFIHRFGFMVMYLLLSSYKRPFNPKESIEKNNEKRTAWLNNALNFNSRVYSEVKFFDRILKYVFVKESNDKVFYSKEFLQSTLPKFYQIMEKLYPNTIEDVKNIERVIDSVSDDIKHSWLEKPQERLPIIL